MSYSRVYRILCLRKYQNSVFLSSSYLKLVNCPKRFLHNENLTKYNKIAPKAASDYKSQENHLDNQKTNAQQSDNTVKVQNHQQKEQKQVDEKSMAQEKSQQQLQEDEANIEHIGVFDDPNLTLFGKFRKMYKEYW